MILGCGSLVASLLLLFLAIFCVKLAGTQVPYTSNALGSELLRCNVVSVQCIHAAAYFGVSYTVT